MNESTQSTQFRRTVVVDIETVTLDPNLVKGALDALSGRIVCIGILIDDGTQLEELAITDENEVNILTKFWATIRPTDVIVGHNVHEFDIPFIRQRSWILSIRPSRTIDLRKFYTADVWDSMQVWSNWAFKKFVSLDALGTALQCGQKSAHGMDVAQWWAIRDLQAIEQYCLSDVRLTYLVYCKMTYQEPRLGKPQAEVRQPRISSVERSMSVRVNRGRVSPKTRILPISPRIENVPH